MTHHVKPIPEGFHTATPVLTVHDGVRALEFYTKGLGATERMRSTGPGGKIQHAEFVLGDSIFMLSDEFPEMGSKSPKSLGGCVGGIFLYVPDTDAIYHRAIAAGATSLSAPEDMFWGDRHARIRDPFGHEWSIATHKEDLSREEVDKRAKEFYAQMMKRTGQPP
ncbi:MAG: VOC family protein [Thermoplasmata archaeon]